MPEHRLPAETSLGHVRIRVTDRARAESFYQKVLGMTLCRSSDQEAAFDVRPDGSGIVVIEATPGAEQGPRRATGLFHFAILLPDRPSLARAFRHLHAVGWQLQGASDHAVSEALYLADPDGNGIEIYCDRPRESWPQIGPELQMTTERLDLASLLSEAPPSMDGSPWRMPPGTRLGHIHLRVSQLDAAERFYHGVLGFDIVTRAYPGALFMSAGGYHHHVAANVWAGVGAPRPPANATGLIDFSVVIPGDDALERVLDRIRSETSTEPQPVWIGGRAGWRVEDPDGNGVVLIPED